ncbi:ABC transporter permease [Vaginisenegalia massiliensis]|uniref:ABC transporter permease n=1 Tax=Vaginisenegalia massiliensis TaxID=2058294 RepID=UPI0013DDE5CF|nr:ABC transporter permease [Vaginisenegalia massiliensis]
MNRNLQSIWQQRFQHFSREVGKYSRYIFNDHFSVILLVMLGFAAFYYRNQLELLQTFPKASLHDPILLGMALWLGLVFQMGRPVWFTKATDKSYLFPLGHEWRMFWLKGLGLGLVLPLIALVGAVFLVYPFVRLISHWSLNQMWALVILSWLLKLTSFFLIYLDQFNVVPLKGLLNRTWFHSVVYMALLLVVFFVKSPWDFTLVLVCLGIIAGGLLWLYHLSKHGQMQFDQVVELETHRQAQVYKWVAVFTDVPNRPKTLRNIRLFDGLIQVLRPLMRDRFSFLYIRMLCRNSAYSGVWLKVILFIGLLLALSPQIWLQAGLGLIGYGLTLIQLLPLMNAYDHHPLQQILPKETKQQLRAFQKTVAIILAIQTCVDSLILLLCHPISGATLIVILGWFVAVVVMVGIYLPFWGHKQPELY